MIFNGRKIKDITGKRSGRLVAVRPVTPDCRYGEGNKQILWECQCDCGEQTIQRSSRITGGERKSCGCLMSGGRKAVRKGNQKAKPHEVCGNIPLSYVNALAAKAKKRGLRFDISPEYLRDLFESQKGKCALSGRLLKLSVRWKFGEMTASLDRIDSSVGYVEGNLQWVHKIVNMTKTRMDDADFIEWCKERWEIMRDVANMER